MLRAVLSILCGVSVALICCGSAMSAGHLADAVGGVVIADGFPRKDLASEAGRKDVPYPKRKNRLLLTEPGVLLQPDTEYVISQDIVADGTAFTIKASGITLNLNGHTVTYLNKAAQQAVFGIYVPGYRRKDIAIVNGRIVQGEGAVASKVNCPAIYDYDASDVEIGGIELVYHTPDTSGILLHWVSDARIHDNTVIDQGDVVTNRHQGVAAIDANRGGKGWRHVISGNLIKGARHNGIRAGRQSEIRGNAVEINSQVTNSCGISGAGIISANRVIGRGVHPIGIWPANDVKVLSNFVEVQNTKRGEEYGDTGASCLRMTWGNDNVEVRNNTFILFAEDTYRGTGVKSWGRALWVGLPKPEQRAIFDTNYIAALDLAGTAKAAAVAVVCQNESSHLEFRNNIIISSWSNILLADSYGHAGGYARFVDNRLIRHGDNPVYKTVRSQYAAWPSTAVLIGNSFESGASLDLIEMEFSGTATKELAIGGHLNITVTRGEKQLSGAQLAVFDNEGSQVATAVTGSDGRATVELVEYVLTNGVASRYLAGPHAHYVAGQRVEKTPHRVVVTYAGASYERKLQMHGNTQLLIEL